MPGRWRGPPRIARSCCRRWPATTRPIRPAPTARSRITGPRYTARSRGCGSALVRHFYERDHEANAATREAIAAARKMLEGLGCSVREVTLSPLADWSACGVTIMTSEAYAIHEANLRTPLHRFRRDLPRPHGAGRADLGRRLRPGIAPPPRIDRRVRRGDGRSRPGHDRRRAERGAADRRGPANSACWSGRT